MKFHRVLCTCIDSVSSVIENKYYYFCLSRWKTYPKPTDASISVLEYWIRHPVTFVPSRGDTFFTFALEKCFHIPFSSARLRNYYGVRRVEKPQNLILSTFPLKSTVIYSIYHSFSTCITRNMHVINWFAFNLRICYLMYLKLLLKWTNWNWLMNKQTMIFG